MSLVSGDYDDDGEELTTTPPEDEQIKTDVNIKRKSANLFAPTLPTSKAKKQKPIEDELPPPLPAEFASASVPKISVTKSPPAPRFTIRAPCDEDDNVNVDMSGDRKRSFLVPPQIWKKQANIATEDTSSWTTARKKNRKSAIAVETM
jgi:hypothetical protein